mmetsp:Transcript_99567/g.187248  ORF Transcript_99567/g.187248 Transcript_99567/m.187248 type:complete len:542 (-) Transcript_99567:155-1780(-)
MATASSDGCQCPPGREGAYSALGDAGYATVAASRDAAQMSVYIRRAIAFHGGVVLEEEALSLFAQVRCADPGNYTDLCRHLNACPWIAWPGQEPLTAPGLQHPVSTHEESPKAAGCAEPSAMSFDDYSGFLACRSSEDVQLEPSADVDMEEPSAPPVEEESPSAPPTSELDDLQSSKLAEPSDAQATQNSTAQASQSEVHMNSAELCREPFETIGPLVVTAPPLRPQHMFSRRMFFLVLRNPSDASRGLVLCSNTDRSVVSQTGHGILQELDAVGPELVSALAEPAVYDALNHDPALLAAVAASYQAGENGLSQLLGGFSSNSTTPAPVASVAPEGSASSSSDAAPESSAPAVEEAHPEEETGECPICFEEIHPGEAAMRCAGEGGQHHYFHARCLQEWIRSRGSFSATCPVCRGRLQFNGQRLNEFLNSEGSAGLNQEERTMFQAIADGLRGRNGWSDMTSIEKAAHIGGLFAAAGFGFMLGYSGSHNAERATMEVMHHCQVPRNHQIAQGVGWVAGLLARVIREVTRDREQCSERRRRR